MTIHANERWPKAITANLWPHAIRCAKNILNNTPSFQLKNKDTPNEVFTNTKVQVSPKHCKPFGCPVCALNPSL